MRRETVFDFDLELVWFKAENDAETDAMEAGLSDLAEEISGLSARAQLHLEMGKLYVERVVARIHPDIQVFFHGSRSYDAALPTSDVDCGILMPP